MIEFIAFICYNHKLSDIKSCPTFLIALNMPKLSLGIFKRISNKMYHYLTLNVRFRTEKNIPHINFIAENNPDSVAL